MTKLISITRSNHPDKKMMATFENDGRRKTVHFGARGMNDYTSFPKAIREKRKELYLSRHKANENWNDPESPGALSRYILWNKPSLQASIADYKRRFNFS